MALMPTVANMLGGMMGYRAYDPRIDFPGLVGWFSVTRGATVSGGVVTQLVCQKSGVIATPRDSSSRFNYLAMGKFGTPSLQSAGTAAMNFTPPSNWPKNMEPGIIAVSGFLNSATGNGRWPFFYGRPVSNRDSGFPGRYNTHSDQYDGQTRGMVKTGVGGVGGNSLTSKMWLNNYRFVLSSFDVKNAKPYVGTQVDDAAIEATALTDSTMVSNNEAGFIGYFAPYGDRWDGEIKNIYVGTGIPTAKDATNLAWFDSWDVGENGANFPDGHPGKAGPPMVYVAGATRRRSAFVTVARDVLSWLTPATSPASKIRPTGLILPEGLFSLPSPLVTTTDTKLLAP